MNIISFNFYLLPIWVLTAASIELFEEFCQQLGISVFGGGELVGFGPSQYSYSLFLNQKVLQILGNTETGKNKLLKSSILFRKQIAFCLPLRQLIQSLWAKNCMILSHNLFRRHYLMSDTQLLTDLLTSPCSATLLSSGAKLLTIGSGMTAGAGKFPNFWPSTSLEHQKSFILNSNIWP